MGGYVGINNLARKITKAYVGVPASYTPVEYIESSGTQYIDTGVVRDITKKFRFVASVKWSDIQTRQCIGAQGYVYFGVSGGKYQIAQGGTTTTNINATTGSFENIDLTFNCPSSTCTGTVNNTSVGTISVTYQNSPENAHIHLFSLNDLVLPCSVQIASFQIYENDVLVRNFIPVLDDNNVACLYELVEGKFYYNKGSGTFAAGSATGSPVSIGNVAREIQKGYVGVPVSYTPVDYIESSGTQYIDTGYKLDSNQLQAKFKVYTSSMPTAEQDILSNQDNTSSRFVIGLYDSKVFGYSRNSQTQDTNVYSSTYSGSQTLEIEATYNYANLTKSLKVNGTTTTQTQNATISPSNNNIILLRNASDLASYFVGKFYYCQIYDNNTLVRDFIPVIDQDNVACLYEQVEGKLYYNQGTGTFTAGSTTGQEVVLSSVARLCYSASDLPDTALLLCHLDDSSTNEITGNDAAPTNGIQSYSTGKWDKAATIKATTVGSDYSKTTTIYSLRDTNLPNVYNILNGSASPVTVTGWLKSGTNDGWIFAYGYWYYIRYGAQTNYSYRCGVGVAPSNNYLQAKIMYRTSDSGSPLTASLTTDIANTVYADGNWHHYAIEVDSTGMNFYFDGVYKGHVNKPSGFLSDGFSNTVHFSLGDEIMVCSGLLYNKNNFTPPSSPY